VVLVGYSLQELAAPAWLVVGALIPLDLLLLWYVVRSARKMLIAYPSIWALYMGFHVLRSTLLRYDFLIPAWRLRS
jgi:hypothetical protein